jgi:hypothetical protein
MTEENNSGQMPVGHFIFRALLGSLVISLFVTAVVLAVLHRSGELAVGQTVWTAVKKSALP